jgi:transcriptional regulator with PAS, ATPase and Fis domain
VAVWGNGHTSLAVRAGQSVVIGRDATCDLRIEHPSVSRRHARLVLGSHMTVEDLNSHNGTYLSASRLLPGRPVTLPAGALIGVGDAFVAVQVEPSSDRALAQAVEPGARDAAMQRMYTFAKLVAQGGLSVLVTGETGVGKEILCELIHASSPRARKPLVRVNCAAVPEPLLEGELFGYERGAFTGATTSKAGIFEEAHDGSVLLDEVGELPLTVQAKLLRVLESKEVRRLGGSRSRVVDVRFLAATNRDPRKMMAEGTFRADLYYRLAGVVLHIPALRERSAEIPHLAKRLLAQACLALGREPPSITPEAMAALVRHSWPGNVRELRNAMDYAALASGGSPVEAVHLGLDSAGVAASPDSLHAEVEQIERQRILQALEAWGGNQTRAAKLLGISRRTLISRMEEWKLPRPRKGKGR